MLNLNLYDTNFAHQEFMDAIVKAKLVKYIRNQDNWNGITLFTDNCIIKASEVNSKYKIAIILEPPSIHSHAYNNVLMMEDHFDYIFTFIHDILSVAKNKNKYIFYYPGPSSTFIPVEEWNIHKKTKLISMVASSKMITIGHRYRHIIIDSIKYNYPVDFYGPQYIPLKDKKDSMIPYAFSIVVKNSKYKGYFSDHIMDAILCGTIPIYWGTPNIGEYFNEKGILSFDTIEELYKILNKISMEYYESLLPYVKENFEIAKNIAGTDDQIAKKIMELGITV